MNQSVSNIQTKHEHEFSMPTVPLLNDGQTTWVNCICGMCQQLIVAAGQWIPIERLLP